MQLRDGPDRYAAGGSGFDSGETASIGGNGIVDLAGCIIVQPGAYLSRNDRDGDIDVREGRGQRSCGHGLRLRCGEDESIMKILGKQSLPAAAVSASTGRDSAFR